MRKKSARTLGASDTAIFWRVMFPALSGILASTALAFARTVGEYGWVIFIAGHVPGLSEHSWGEAMNRGRRFRLLARVLLVFLAVPGVGGADFGPIRRTIRSPTAIVADQKSAGCPEAIRLLPDNPTDLPFTLTKIDEIVWHQNAYLFDYVLDPLNTGYFSTSPFSISNITDREIILEIQLIVLFPGGRFKKYREDGRDTYGHVIGRDGITAHYPFDTALFKKNYLLSPLTMSPREIKYGVFAFVAVPEVNMDERCEYTLEITDLATGKFFRKEWAREH